ncbi:MAG: hypothetical protein WC527_01100 [Candidatus Margulisiibacteriota bacterium]
MIDLALPDICNHFLQSGTVYVRPAVTLVRINVEDLKIVLA